VPWDSQAEREWGAGEKAYQDRRSALEGDWQSRDEWFGLGETNNPYSQASLLSHRHEVGKRGVMNSAGLQLYSGSTVNARASTDRTFNIGLESLKAAYEAERARKDRELLQAQHEWESEGNEIREGAVGRVAESEPPPAPGPEGGGQPGLGGDPTHPRAYRAGVGAGKAKPPAPPGFHAYKGPGNQWWFAPN
jgi:hypothetical protein